jgi:UDP-3-O-[3-hydroxymyristoyl] glucosamine N-acyltransferase
MQLSAKELAKIVNGNVEGDSSVMIDRPSRIEDGGEGSVSFLGNEKYESFVYDSTASALLVSHKFEPRRPVSSTLIRVDNVYAAMAKVLQLFDNKNHPPRGIADTAFVHPDAQFGKDVGIGHFTVIEANATIGDGSTIHAQVFIGRNVQIGADVTIFPGARILHNCIIGDHCVIHANAVIGSEGFGFTKDEKGHYTKIPQTGNVVLEERVEVGACTTIDRATMGSTIIRAGVKLDNLIQIGHNVEIGQDTAIAAQAGVAGSTKIGRDCQIGGQVGFVGHLNIADGMRVQAQSGVASSIKEANQAFFGSPAIPYNDYIRSYTVFKKLPELYKRINELERRLRKMEEKH